MTGIEIAAVAAAVAIAKNLKDLTSTGSRVPQEVREQILALLDKVIDIQSEVVEAQNREYKLTVRCNELEGDLQRVNDWEEEKARYTLKSLSGGASVYALKPEFEAQEAPHWLCAGCFASGKKSHVQPQGGGVRPQWKCSRCDATFVITRPSRQKR